MKINQPGTRVNEIKESDEDYVVLGIGEGGGGEFEDKPVIFHYPNSEKKVRNGGSYYSLESLQERPGADANKEVLLARHKRRIEKWNANPGNPKRTFLPNLEDHDGAQVSMAKIPLTDNFVNDIFVENVFGDGIVSDEDKVAGISEMIRVLKPGGTINFLENITPEFADLEIFKQFLERTQVGKLKITGPFTGEDAVTLLNQKHGMVAPIGRVFVKRMKFSDGMLIPEVMQIEKI